MTRFLALAFRLTLLAATYAVLTALLVLYAMHSNQDFYAGWTRILVKFYPGFFIPATMVTFWTLATYGAPSWAPGTLSDDEAMFKECESRGVTTRGETRRSGYTSTGDAS
jgi:hypothetical protein